MTWGSWATSILYEIEFPYFVQQEFSMPWWGCFGCRSKWYPDVNYVPCGKLNQRQNITWQFSVNPIRNASCILLLKIERRRESKATKGHERPLYDRLSFYNFKFDENEDLLSPLCSQLLGFLYDVMVCRAQCHISIRPAFTTAKGILYASFTQCIKAAMDISNTW